MIAYNYIELTWNGSKYLVDGEPSSHVRISYRQVWLPMKFEIPFSTPLFGVKEDIRIKTMKHGRGKKKRTEDTH